MAISRSQMSERWRIPPRLLQTCFLQKCFAFQNHIQTLPPTHSSHPFHSSPHPSPPASFPASHQHPVISTEASRSCFCDAQWRDPCIGGYLYFCLSFCHSLWESASAFALALVAVIPKRSRGTCFSRIARLFSPLGRGLQPPKIASDPIVLQAHQFVPRRPDKIISPKNSPKSACQPPTNPQTSQNPRPHCRFLPTGLGIVTPSDWIQWKKRTIPKLLKTTRLKT